MCVCACVGMEVCVNKYVYIIIYIVIVLLITVFQTKPNNIKLINLVILLHECWILQDFIST